ncbi:MAG: hypothetical protein ACI9GH_000118 [Candidatus Paceibacteria bacterium]|jgi:hypothetical protein
MGHPFGFIAEWNTLLPLIDFIEDPKHKVLEIKKNKYRNINEQYVLYF